MTDKDNSSSSTIGSNNRRMHHDDITMMGSEQNISARSMNPFHPSRWNESPLLGKLELQTGKRSISSSRLKLNPEFDRTESDTSGSGMVSPVAKKKRYYPGYDGNSFERKVLQKRETSKTSLFSLNSDLIEEHRRIQIHQIAEPPKLTSAKKNYVERIISRQKVLHRYQRAPLQSTLALDDSSSSTFMRKK
eukprot:232979_1